MRNIFSAISGPIIAFAAIICLFSCSPIENEPNVCPPAPVDTTDTVDVVVDAPEYSGYTYGFYYGKTYTATVYRDSIAPESQDIKFINDSVAIAEDATFYTEWNIDGVTLYLNYGDPYYEEEFVFYYFNLLDNLQCFKSDDLTIVITK